MSLAPRTCARRMRLSADKFLPRYSRRRKSRTRICILLGVQYSSRPCKRRRPQISKPEYCPHIRNSVPVPSAAADQETRATQVCRNGGLCPSCLTKSLAGRRSRTARH